MLASTDENKKVSQLPSDTLPDILTALRNDNFETVMQCIRRGDWNLQAYNEAVIRGNFEIARAIRQNHPDRRND